MRLRAVFDEEEHAKAVLDRLTADGFDGVLVRERLAGEDDDEDHPWSVVTDAPEFVVELLVEQYDGWLDLDDDAPETATGVDVPALPLDLPDAPRRTKGHFPRD